MHLVDHGHAARTAHWQSADAVCVIARRRGRSAWRFLLAHRHCATREPNRPALIDFVIKCNVGVWRLVEVTEMTSEACHPLDARSTQCYRRREHVGLSDGVDGLLLPAIKKTQLALPCEPP